MHHVDADKMYREKANKKLHTNTKFYNEQILEATAVWSLSSQL